MSKGFAMSRRNVLVNNATGKVDRIRSDKLEVRRDDGGFIIFLHNKKLQGRDMDVAVALQGMKNADLRQRIITAMSGKDIPLEQLREEMFRGYKVEDEWPED